MVKILRIRGLFAKDSAQLCHGSAWGVYDACTPCDAQNYEPYEEGRRKATWKREFKLPWREAGPPNHHDDKVDSDQ